MTEPEYNFLSKLNEISPILLESDLDAYVTSRAYDDLLPYIENLARKTIPHQELDELRISSFKESSKQEIKNSLNTFIFKSKLWKDDRNPVPYIKLCLKRMAGVMANDRNGVQQALVMVCPLCLYNNNRTYLHQNTSLWECSKCNIDFEKYQNQLQQALKDKNQKLASEAQINLKSILVFKAHSRKGYCCPDCKKFIPHSAATQFGISCPYPNCFFFGDISGLELMNHPLGLGRSLQARSTISMDSPICKSDSDGTATLSDITYSKNQILQDDILQVKQESEKEFFILLQSIEELISIMKRQSTSATKRQKILMLEAYKNLCNQMPQEMVSYLVHRKQSSETPLQSRIFQEYVSLIENSLPFHLKKGDKKTLIMSLTDENLNLFLGQSQYDSVVGMNNIIPNETKEIYIGDRTHKHYGPCFIGKIIDVIDLDTNQSLIKDVESYSFVQIVMHARVRVGTRVRVIHFRIPCHYETKHMVYAQRMRRSIVDKIYYKLNKKKRDTKK